MKKCQYCGCENPDETESCSACGKTHSNEYSEASIPAAARWLLWLFAWGGVILVTILNDPQNLRLFLGFPVGFFGLFPAEQSILFTMVGGLFLVMGGWIVYIMLSVRILRSKSAAFWIYYVIFCILLALNVGGCGLLIHTASGIH